MALTDEGSNGFYMPVAPAYGGGYGNNGNNGFGGDWAWVILLLLAFGGGWGNGFGGGFGGGYGNMMLGMDFPWLLNGQNNINANTNSGFRDAMLNDGITSIRDGINGLSAQLCGCCGDMQMANMQQAFGMQTAIMGGLNNLSAQFANCCCENRLGIANLAADISRENCADREALNYGVRDIINNQTAGIQRILDKLCDQELQAERRDNANLRSELMYARGQASQIEQTAQIRAGQNAAVNSLVNELRSCPIPAQPVYGSQPIFTCPQTVNTCGCGCGCGGNSAF